MNTEVINREDRTLTQCICKIYDLFGFDTPAAVGESIQALDNMCDRPLSDAEKTKLEELLQWLNSGHISCLTLVEQVRKVTRT